MGRRLASCAISTLALCACKVQLSGVPGDGSLRTLDGAMPGSDAGSPPDVAVDAYVLGDFSAPQPVTIAATSGEGEDDCTLSSNQLELYFARDDGTNGNKRLFEATRATTADPWGPPQLIFPSSEHEESPRLSPDDLTIYFGRDGDIYSASRAAPGDPWGAPSALASVDTNAYEKWMAVCDNGYFLVSRDNGASGQDLFEGQLGSAGTLSTILSSNDSEISSFLSKDCLTAYFASDRGGNTQIYTSTRASVGSPWSPPVPADFGPSFGTATDNEDAWISTDQRTLYFATKRGNGNKDVYFATR